MKHILLSALLLAALPTAAMAETDLGSVLMETVFDWFYAILKGFVQS